MLRVVLENILLFLLPAALYVTYMLLVRQPGGSAQQVLNEAPLVWLFVMGLLVLVAGFVLFGSMKEGLPSQSYEPPVYKDGKIVPGQIR